ncbi:unnamed protein product [Calicophoron daubneyi]|uniref:DUF4806 domain-containing protein n=1 Tax=Calicophoron daubneyi TaxID=300641 RepID=A0AAV2TX73_CALDB
MASAYAQKIRSQDDESDTSPCKGVPHRRRPRPIRRYTPNPTDEEAHATGLQTAIPLLNSTAISPVAGPSSATTIKYPAMRPNYISDDVAGVLNLTMLGENVNSQPAISQPKGYEAAIFSAIMELKEDFKSFKNEVKSELKELSARIENTNLYVATLDTQVNKYHCDVVGKTCNASPTKPRWLLWFPLQTVTDVNTMEQNLQDENCRADVVSFLQRTPMGKISDRTKYCLSRMISDELSKNLSWLKTPNRQSFGSTTLWAIILG